MSKVKVGDRIKIIKMEGEPQYPNREGQIHSTWGRCAIIPKVDAYIVLPNTVK